MTTTDSPSAADLSQLALDLYQRSAFGTAVRASDLLTQARRVSRWLASMGVIQTMLVISIWHTVNSATVVFPVMKVMALSASVMAALFWLLWLWSKESPLPPVIAALTIYVTMWWVTAAYTWAALARQFGEDGANERFPPDFSTLVRWIVTIGLLRAVIAGAKHRKLSNQLANAGDAPTLGSSIEPPQLPLASDIQPRRIAGLASSMGLFFVLLYIILDFIALWGRGELTPSLYQRMVMVNAIIIITWSIACWRDVYRPLAKIINPLWYIGAIVGGGITLAISTGWLYVVRQWADLPTPDLSTMAMTDSPAMQILLIAVTPAIVEEVAFRGIIFGAFLRSLRGWETVVVSALMFMVLHAAVPSFPHLLVLGVILGVLRLKSGSWLPGVFLHFTHNYLVILMHSK